ncbi:MAG TPA: HAD family hydrolase [Arachnia sp.]|nr:HAD family hydrolase [Arachnia sp.]HMT84885.1 HAD family hydrolase [Arachnia sp.]
MTDRAALFDLDGTLTDTVALIATQASRTLTEFGIPCLPEDVVPYIGIPLADCIQAVAPGFVEDERFPAFARLYRSRVAEATAEAGPDLLLPGVAELLPALREAGWKVAVVTAKQTEVAQTVLASTGLTEAVDMVIGTDQVAAGKPAPDSAYLAMERLGTAPERTWYIGDAATDMQMTLAAGIPGLGITTGAGTREGLLAAGARVVVDSAHEVFDALRG